MKALLFGADEAVALWVWRRTSANDIQPSSQGAFRALGVVEDGDILAGFIFHNWNPAYQTIEMTLAADTPRWASRSMIRRILSYPFDFCQRVTVMVREDNAPSLRLAEGVGFRREFRHERAAGRDKALISLRLFDDEWRAGPFGPKERP